MNGGKSQIDQFEVFKKNFLFMQKKYDEKIKELSVIKEMNNTMQQVDFIDQDQIWIRLLECLKKYKGLAGAALYFSPDNEVKRDYFFYTDFEEQFDFSQLKRLPFFNDLLDEQRVIVIEKLGGSPSEDGLVEKEDGGHELPAGYFGKVDIYLKALSSTEAVPFLSESEYAFYGQSILSNEKVIAVLMLFARDKAAFEASHLYFYNVVCEHFHNSMRFLRLYYGKLDEEKQMIHMSRFFSKNIIGEVIKKGKLRLGGEKKEAAVIFADLKGFTTLSESMAPEAVVILLNHFFSCMIPIIFKNGGTLDKLLGDGIMAVFGAPLEDKNACCNAVRTALEMFLVLEKLNLELKGDYNSLEMTVGINHGELIAGLMGSREHMNYTVVGDTVNAAQRIQSMAQSNEILISESVWHAVAPEIDSFEAVRAVSRLDNVKLKGKEKTVTLFRLTPEI